MNRHRCPPPTDEQLRSITAFIRSGGFPLVAAEAAGVSRERFEQWLQLGRVTRPPREDTGASACSTKPAAQGI